MTFDLHALQTAVASHRRVSRVVVVASAGSVPRSAGTAMLVWDGGQLGTIGGGRLEYEAAEKARQQSHPSAVYTIPLGPELGQCCGGSVTLAIEAYTLANLPDSFPFARRLGPGSSAAPDADGFAWQDGWLIEQEQRASRDIWIYGAGHVGRALVAVLSPLPDIAITWVDTAPSRFPNDVPASVSRFVAAAPDQAVHYAPEHAEHLILTYDHQMDLSICHAVLSRAFGSAGLIGSATKWARFRKRLAQLGHSSGQVARIACPIGDIRLGKHPQQIAIGVAMAMLGELAADRREGAG